MQLKADQVLAQTGKNTSKRTFLGIFFTQGVFFCVSIHGLMGKLIHFHDAKNWPSYEQSSLSHGPGATEAVDHF